MLVARLRVPSFCIVCSFTVLDYSTFPYHDSTSPAIQALQPPHPSTPPSPSHPISSRPRKNPQLSQTRGHLHAPRRALPASAVSLYAAAYVALTGAHERTSPRTTHCRPVRCQPVRFRRVCSPSSLPMVALVWSGLGNTGRVADARPRPRRVRRWLGRRGVRLN